MKSRNQNHFVFEKKLRKMKLIIAFHIFGIFMCDYNFSPSSQSNL